MIFAGNTGHRGGFLHASLAGIGVWSSVWYAILLTWCRDNSDKYNVDTDGVQWQRDIQWPYNGVRIWLQLSRLHRRWLFMSRKSMFCFMDGGVLDIYHYCIVSHRKIVMLPLEVTDKNWCIAYWISSLSDFQGYACIYWSFLIHTFPFNCATFDKISTNTVCRTVFLSIVTVRDFLIIARGTMNSFDSWQ